jgi:hypothetical protein
VVSATPDASATKTGSSRTTSTGTKHK